MYILWPSSCSSSVRMFHAWWLIVCSAAAAAWLSLLQVKADCHELQQQQQHMCSRSTRGLFLGCSRQVAVCASAKTACSYNPLLQQYVVMAEAVNSVQLLCAVFPSACVNLSRLGLKVYISNKFFLITGILVKYTSFFSREKEGVKG